MAKAYKCDLCKKYIDGANSISGIDFQIGVWNDSLTGSHPQYSKIGDICNDCKSKLIDRAKELYVVDEKRY